MESFATLNGLWKPTVPVEETTSTGAVGETTSVRMKSTLTEPEFEG